MNTNQAGHHKPERAWPGVIVWTAGLAATVIAYFQISDDIVNVVNYDVTTMGESTPAITLSLTIPLVVLACVFFVMIRRKACAQTCNEAGRLNHDQPYLSLTAAKAGWPLALTIVISAWWVWDRPINFMAMSWAIIGLAWSIDRLGRGAIVPRESKHWHRIAPLLLVSAILASTVWHTLQQVNFWQHFLLGYADFGLFTTELEHCLPWKDVGSARFSDTRMGYHFVPMFYLLVPFYALFRSPIFLMAVGTLALNVAAIPFYQLAKHRTQSSMVALLVGLAWLALPSMSRLPYSNTYGFQSIYLAVPWLAWTFSLAMQNRWRLSHLCLFGAMLCEETVCGAALGWGLYLWLWGGRRRDGLCIAAGAVAYLILCTTILIPAFQGEGEYTRLMLFGELSPATILDRLTRSRVPMYLLALAGPMLFALVRQWRMLLIAMPTLSLVLLMHQTDYLNIKYWHHSSILPVLFTAATLGITCKRDFHIQVLPAAGFSPRGGTKVNDDSSTNSHASIGGPMALLVCVLLFHFWMGSSPFAQSQRIYSANQRLNSPDPRMKVIDLVRAQFPPKQTTIVATERMAAHFTDYRMVLPAPLIIFAHTVASPHLLILDRSDTWDKIGLEQTFDQTLSQASDAGFTLIKEHGPVLILANEATRE